jgi:hypothetical protein
VFSFSRTVFSFCFFALIFVQILFYLCIKVYLDHWSMLVFIKRVVSKRFEWCWKREKVGLRPMYCRCAIATREKTTFLCLRTFALFTLCTLLNAIICCSQHNTQGVLGRLPESGLLVIDAVGLRPMYFVVMPRVNLIVILMTYVCYLYSINCPTVICLPSMLLFILWRDTASELWTLVQFPLN